jgi:hypothetical protein
MADFNLNVGAFTARAMLDSFVMAFDDENRDNKTDHMPSICDFAAFLGVYLKDAIVIAEMAAEQPECIYRISAPGFICGKK